MTAAHPGQDTSGLLAVLPFETIGGDTGQRYFSAGMTEEIAGQLSKLSALRVVSASATDPTSDFLTGFPGWIESSG